MNVYRLISFGLTCASGIFFLLAFINEELNFGIALIFPFIIGSGIFSFCAILCLFIAFFLLFYHNGWYARDKNGSFSENINENQEFNHKTKADVKGGGIVFIGPFPIFFGTSKKLVLFMIVLFMVIFLTLIFFRFYK